MGRVFDGSGDKIDFGSDASIDSIFISAPKTGSLWAWVNRSSTGTTDQIFAIGNGADTPFSWRFIGSNVLRVSMAWDGGATLMRQDTTTAFSSTGVSIHHGMSYDANSGANFANMYTNAVLDNGTPVNTGTVAPTVAATDVITIGEDPSGNNDLGGTLGWVGISTTIMTAADFNRARWWGRPFGGCLIYHPLVTDKLDNEGSGTAPGTATNTTVASLVCPVVRPGTAMMGMGIGW